LTGDDAHGESSGGETATAGGSARDAAGARVWSAVEDFSQALKACEGSRQRLARLAQTARATATAFRECHAMGFRPSGRRVDAGARAPWELRRDGPRLAISEWQLFDRSFETMLFASQTNGPREPIGSAWVF
jgi:hypothetical protein